jgi:putative hydrolase of the HAD superfamily
MPGRPGAVLVAVGGLVATGKSSLSRALAAAIGAECIQADALRDALLGKQAGEPLHESRWERSFHPRLAEEVYAELLRRAEGELASGRPVVLDACFPRQGLRERARALARRSGCPFLFVECRIDAACLRARLAARSPEDAGARWQEIAADLAARWEPPQALAPDELLCLDTSRPLAELVAKARERLPRAPEAPLKPEGVTFDCWNTLIVERAWEVAHARRVEALERAAREAGRPVGRSHAAAAFDAAWERHMRLWTEGLHSGAPEVARWSLASLGVRRRGAALAQLVETFQEASHSGRVEAVAGARETLCELARAGLRRALVCDTGLTPGRVVRRLLEHAGLLEHLEVQVFSDEVGFPKPDPRAFRAALDPLGVEPRRALHVGDLRRTDVAGARGVGMRSVRIRAAHDDASPLPEADFVVASHAELRALLRLGSR